MLRQEQQDHYKCMGLSNVLNVYYLLLILITWTMEGCSFTKASKQDSGKGKGWMRDFLIWSLVSSHYARKFSLATKTKPRKFLSHGLFTHYIHYFDQSMNYKVLWN